MQSVVVFIGGHRRLPVRQVVACLDAVGTHLKCHDALILDPQPNFDTLRVLGFMGDPCRYLPLPHSLTGLQLAAFCLSQTVADEVILLQDLSRLRMALAHWAMQNRGWLTAVLPSCALDWLCLEPSKKAQPSRVMRVLRSALSSESRLCPSGRTEELPPFIAA